MAQTDPLLLLDNGTLAYIIGNGDYRFTNIKFEEARAIIDMKGEADVVRVFANPDLEHSMYEYLGIQQGNFQYAPVRSMKIGQDAIALHNPYGNTAHRAGRRRTAGQKNQEYVHILPACGAPQIEDGQSGPQRQGRCARGDES